MTGRKLVAMALFFLFIAYAGAFYCGKGDRGGRLLSFTVSCHGYGEVKADCSNGSDRSQCYKIKSCSLGGCGTVLDEDYMTSCEANCEDGSTFVEVTCEPLPLSVPAMNLPFDDYNGYVDLNFVIEGFAADSEFIKDIYFEAVEGCDLNQVKEGIGTERASVNATFTCSQLFTAREIKLVAKDECTATGESAALLSVEKYCGKECVPRLYPQCREDRLIECIEEDGCTELLETGCEHGCEENICCVPLSCRELGFECGETFNNCDENISCGSCVEGTQCSENKCVEIISDQGTAPGLPLLPQAPAVFGFDPILIGVVVIVVVVAIVVLLRLRK